MRMTLTEFIPISISNIEEPGLEGPDEKGPDPKN